jgi:hypothetical protein
MHLLASLAHSETSECPSAPKAATQLWDRGWHRNGAQSAMRSDPSARVRFKWRRRFASCICAIMEDLAESLGEGTLVGHPSMSVFRFDPDQIENLIAYLKTLEKR